MELEIKDYHEAEALYNAIETQLEGMATESLERDRLEKIRYRVEMLMVEYQESTRGNHTAIFRGDST